MNVKKTKKLAVLSLVLLGVAVVLGIVFFVMFTADMVAFAQTYGPDATPESVDVLFELFSTGTLVTLGLLSLLGVVDVVITIMLAVQTSKFESKVPMIFLLVGLAVGVLKIVGVVMTLVQCNKQPKAGDASEVANN